MHCGSKKVRCCLWSSVFHVRFLMWIIDSSQGSSWQHCNYTHWGLTYIGSINITQEGLTCQRWDSKWPHAMISNITDVNFPDGSKSAAQNFCRNPSPKDRNKNFSYTPWCHTTDPNVSWQYCKPYRDDNGSGGSTSYSACVLEKHGAGYSGHVAFTRSGFACDLWRYHWDSTFVFPDGSAKKARNYCRNPTPTSRKGPWCYTTSDLVRWDYCDVCIPYRGAIVRREELISRNRIKLPSMPLVNCLHWCITYLSCVGIDFQRDKEECWYTPFKSETINSDKSYDHYDVDRKCLGVATGPLNLGQQAVERSTVLQKHPAFRSNKVMLKTGGILKTVFEEMNTKAPNSSLFAQKLKIGGVEGSGQLAPDGRAEDEISANRSEVRAGCAGEAGLRCGSGTMIGESQTESTDRAGGIRGTAKRPERLIRQKRAEGFEVPGESRISVREERRELPSPARKVAEVINEAAAVKRDAGQESTTQHSVPVTSVATNTTGAPEVEKKSKLTGVLTVLMIAMAAVVLISTIYACCKISSGKKTADTTAKPAVKEAPEKDDKPDGGKQSEPKP